MLSRAGHSGLSAQIRNGMRALGGGVSALAGRSLRTNTGGPKAPAGLRHTQDVSKVDKMARHMVLHRSRQAPLIGSRSFSSDSDSGADPFLQALYVSGIANGYRYKEFDQLQISESDTGCTVALPNETADLTITREELTSELKSKGVFLIEVKKDTYAASVTYNDAQRLKLDLMEFMPRGSEGNLVLAYTYDEKNDIVTIQWDRTKYRIVPDTEMEQSAKEVFWQQAIGVEFTSLGESTVDDTTWMTIARASWTALTM